MYTVSKGPSKIVAKTRRGLTQNYEKFETIKESGKRNGDLNSPEKNNVPRPVFQPIKKSVVPAKVVEETVLSPQHEEIIRYINDSWNIIVAHNPYDTAAACKAASQADRNNNSCSITNHMSSSHSTNLALNTNASASIASAAMNGNCSSSSNVSTTSSMYCIEPPSPVLSDFKPFDLESWWGRRLFNNITKSL